MATVSNWRTANRTERFEYRLLTQNLQPVGLLDGVESCSLSGSVFSDVRWGGKITWSGNVVPDLTTYLVHPWYIVSGDDGVEESYPLAPPCYARSSSVAQSDLVPATTDMDLYDVSYRLAKRLKLTGELAVASGGVITDTVVSRLAATGARYSATPSARTLTAALNWAIGTSEMKVLNDMLSAAGYWSVAADLGGSIVVAPWVDPRQRAASYMFGDGEASITGAIVRSKDDFDVPNRMTGVQRVQEGQAPLTVTVTLDTVSPSSPYTYAARGYWVDGEPLLDQDAADLATLTSAVTRSLLSAADSGETLTLTHAWVPEVLLGVVVGFRGALYTVQKMTVNCDLGLPVQAEWSKVVL